MATITGITPNLVVRDLDASLRFYRDVLGFAVSQTVPPAPPFVFAWMVRAGCDAAQDAVLRDARVRHHRSRRARADLRAARGPGGLTAMRTIDHAEALTLLEAGAATLLDVRTPAEYAELGHLPGGRAASSGRSSATPSRALRNTGTPSRSIQAKTNGGAGGTVCDTAKPRTSR